MMFLEGNLIYDLINDFINRLRDIKEWNLEVYIGVLFAIISVTFSFIVWILSKIFNFFWNLYQRKSLEKLINPEAYPESVIKFATKYYIRPLCSTNVDPSNENEISNARPTTEDLFSYVDRFLSEDLERRFLIILADSGMGKTSFALNYFASNKGKWLFWKKRRLALVHLGTQDVIEQINSIERKNETDLILDAFDEDTKATSDYKSRLEEIFNNCSKFKHVIITCRTQFFPKDDEIPINTGLLRVESTRLGQSKVYELHKLYLMPFNSKQVDKYLKKRFPYFWNLFKCSKAKRIVQKIPLLSVRPMLLTHIPDLMETDVSINYTAQLYEILIEKWLDRESHWVNKDDLFRFSIELAVEMYINREKHSTENYSRESLVDLASAHNIPLDDWQITGRSLLNRDAIGNYKFAHRSVMEYLFILKFLSGDQRCKFITWTDLMKDFLLDFLNINSGFAKNAKIEWRKNKHLSLILDDCKIIEFHGEQMNLKGADLSNINFNYFRFSSLMLLRTLFDFSTRSQSITTSEIIISNINFEGSNFSNSKFNRVWFWGCNLSKSAFTNTDLYDSKFLDSKVSLIDFSKCNYFRVNFVNCNIFGAIIPSRTKNKVEKLNTSPIQFIENPDESTEIYECVSQNPNRLKLKPSIFSREAINLELNSNLPK